MWGGGDKDTFDTLLFLEREKKQHTNKQMLISTLYGVVRKGSYLFLMVYYINLDNKILYFLFKTSCSILSNDFTLKSNEGLKCRRTLLSYIILEYHNIYNFNRILEDRITPYFIFHMNANLCIYYACAARCASKSFMIS